LKKTQEQFLPVEKDTGTVPPFEKGGLGGIFQYTQYPGKLKQLWVGE
jgi:hypothetical protein